MAIRRTIEGTTRDHRRLRASIIVTALWLAVWIGWVTIY